MAKKDEQRGSLQRESSAGRNEIYCGKIKLEYKT